MRMPEPGGAALALGKDAAATLATEIPVLGIPTRFATNSAAALRVVEEAFGAWRTLPDSLIAPGPPLSVRLAVGVGAARAADATVRHLVPGDGRLLIHARGAVGVSDPRRGEAMAAVSPELLADTRLFRSEVLEAMTWALLTRRDRQPLHAAGLARNGAGLLLCGATGTGKSTLAYAAARSGVPLLAEDMVFVESVNRLRVWGKPAAFHLLPHALTHFPELAEEGPTTLRGGRSKRVVSPPGSGAALAAPPVVDACGLCVLGPRRRVPEWRPLEWREAVSLIDLNAAGFDVFAASIVPAVERLADRGAWLLHPSDDPHAALPALLAMLGQVAAAPGSAEVT